MATRGRLDKRAAILGAAEDIFLRDGRVEAAVAEIAARAGVAKPTLYAHFGSREGLVTAVADAALDRIAAENDVAVEALYPVPDDLEQGLLDVAWALIRSRYRNPETPGLRRLVQAHAAGDPDLSEHWRAHGPHRLIDALAGRLARLANAGHLVMPDPDRAAHQFIALISFTAEHPPIGIDTDAELDDVLRADVAMFLRAYR